MSWYKRSFKDFPSAIQSVQAALLALKYTHPELDPRAADFNALVQALGETGRIPPGVNPERFAAMTLFYLNHQHEVDEL